MVFALDNRSSIRKQIPGVVSSIGASKTMVLDFPVGPTYEGIFLRCTIAGVAPTRAQFESMWLGTRVLMSGRPIHQNTALEQIAISEFYNSGIVGATGVYYLPFNRPWMRETGAVRNPALGTVGETSFQIEIIQDATTTIDGVEAWAVINPVAQPLGYYVRTEKLTLPISAAGESVWNGLRPMKGEFLLAAHIRVSTAADLTSYTLEADGIRVWDTVTQTMAARFYADAYPRVRTMQDAKKVISFDFSCLGFDSDGIPMTMDSLVHRLNFANAPTTVVGIFEIATGAETQPGAK